MSEPTELTPNDIVVLELCKILEATGDFLKETNARREMLWSLMEPSDEIEKERAEVREQCMDISKKFEELHELLQEKQSRHAVASASAATQLAVAMDREPVQDGIEVPVHRLEVPKKEDEDISEEGRNESSV